MKKMQITIKLKPTNNDEAKRLFMKIIGGERLTYEEWDILKSEGMVKSNPLRRK